MHLPSFVPFLPLGNHISYSMNRWPWHTSSKRYPYFVDGKTIFVEPVIEGEEIEVEPQYWSDPPTAKPLHSSRGNMAMHKVATTAPSFQQRVCFTDHRKEIQEENRKSV